MWGERGGSEEEEGKRLAVGWVQEEEEEEAVVHLRVDPARYADQEKEVLLFTHLLQRMWLYLHLGLFVPTHGMKIRRNIVNI